MARPPIALWYDVFGGYNAQQIQTLRQDQELLELSQAQDVIGDPIGDLVTVPGSSFVRSTAITNTPAVQGMQHMQDLADKLILVANGKVWQDSANPPAEVTLGTALTAGQDVLARFAIFNDLLIICTQSRDLPQTVNSSVVRADLGGTPARGIDVKPFARRVCMFSPSYSGTTYRSFMSFTSSNDNQAAWTAPVTTNFLNFGQTGSDINLLGGELYKNQLMAFTEDAVFPVYVTPNALLPMASLPPVMNEDGGGPGIIHAVVPGNDRLYWISRNCDVKVLEGTGVVKSIGYAVQPWLRALNQARLAFISGGWEPQYRMVVWNCSTGVSGTHNAILALQVDTGRFFIHTKAYNAFCIRRVSGQLKLLGGTYAGKFANLYDTSTDEVGSAIDADTMTSHLHLGMPGVVKKVPYVAFEMDKIGSEAVTFQYDINDSQSWTSFNESPYTVGGTDTKVAYFRIPRTFITIRLRIRDNTSGERYRVTRLGFPQPVAVTTRFA